MTSRWPAPLVNHDTHDIIDDAITELARLPFDPDLPVVDGRWPLDND